MSYCKIFKICYFPYFCFHHVLYIHKINEATANGTNETLPVTEDDTARIIALSVTLPLLGGLLLALIVLFARLEVRRRRRRKHRHSPQPIRLVQSY